LITLVAAHKIRDINYIFVTISSRNIERYCAYARQVKWIFLKGCVAKATCQI